MELLWLLTVQVRVSAWLNRWMIQHLRVERLYVLSSLEEQDQDSDVGRRFEVLFYHRITMIVGRPPP